MSCRRHFRGEWDSTCGFDPASEPSHPFASTPPWRRVQRRCSVPSRLGRSTSRCLAAHETRDDRDVYDRKLPITLVTNEHPPCVWLPRAFRAFARRLVVPGAFHDASSASATHETPAWAFSSHCDRVVTWPASDVPSPRRFTPRTRFRVRAMPSRPRSLRPHAP